MIANHLKLNDSKTEFMVMRKPSLRKNIEDVTSICIGDTAVHAVNYAKNIGATLDTEMTMTGHIRNTIKSFYSQIRNISYKPMYLSKCYRNVGKFVGDIKA